MFNEGDDHFVFFLSMVCWKLFVYNFLVEVIFNFSVLFVMKEGYKMKTDNKGEGKLGWSENFRATHSFFNNNVSDFIIASRTVYYRQN